jgi:uncharacterized protein YyaL (SSP411 family)
VARDILRDADRDMSLADGGFASATDADSAGPDGRRREGWFFTGHRTRSPPSSAPRPRAPSSPHTASPPRGTSRAATSSIRHAPDAVAQELGITPAALRESLAAARETLYAARGGGRRRCATTRSLPPGTA